MKNRNLYILLFIFPVALIIVGLSLLPLDMVLKGLSRIVTVHSLLLTDYIAVGGLSPALINAGLCGLIAALLVLFNRINVNGPFIAAVYTVTGFAFFGKNILNIWPILGGVWLYSKYQGTQFRNFLVVALFGTTLSPLVSFLSFGTELDLMFSIPLGVLSGILAGFVLPPLASHMLRFHDGYNVYNIGFTGGIIGSFLSAVLRSFDFNIETVEILATGHSLFMGFLLNIFFVVLIITGIILSKNNFSEMKDSFTSIIKSSGRLVSDFVRIGGFESTMINMGLMGIISSLFVIFLGGSFNGPVVGGILTVVGFAAFGKHPRNTIPILFGVFIASFIKVWDTNTTAVIIAGLFGTTLAPIAGQYGFFAGIAAGFFHLSIVMNVVVLHGGINLYNNGFAGGFVASVLVPLIDALKRKED
jgi:hypothetical protein